MFANRRRSRLMRLAVPGAAAVLAVGIAACSSGGSSGPGASSSPTGTKVTGGTATMALPAGITLSYIFPYTPLASSNEYNSEGFQMLMYRPLYYFGDESNSDISINYPLSTANAPVYSADGKTVTIKMKGWKWSDGEAVGATDVIFWLNMMKAEPANFYGYVPGLLPDNLSSYSATGPDTVVLKLKSPASSIWFTYNQLAEITPMPMAWDVSSAGAKPGSGGCTTDSAADKWAKCVAVYNYLSGQAKNSSSYASNPLWAVVDGPWKLSSFSTAGTVSFVPNPSYSGSPKPVISKFEYLAYTDDSTEYTAVKTNSVDVGFIPDQDLPIKPNFSQILPSSNPLGSGYNLQPQYSFSIQFYVTNMNAPAPLGAEFKQLYVRQALQELIDQKGMLLATQRGYGYPTSGGVPNEPKSQWLPSVQNENGGEGPYAFSIAHAKALLTSHGWTEAGGTMTCTDPAKCGAGIPAGAKLAFTMDYATGVTYAVQEVQIYKSDAEQAGIDINTVPQSFNTVIGESTPCTPGPKCTWNALFWGGWNFNGPGFEPTGEPLFATGASSNSPSYSDPTEDKLIQDTHTSNSLSLFQQYATYTAQQLPFIWFPNYYDVAAVNSKLGGVAFNPLADVLPEYWYFTK